MKQKSKRSWRDVGNPERTLNFKKLLAQRVDGYLISWREPIPDSWFPCTFHFRSELPSFAILTIGGTALRFQFAPGYRFHDGRTTLTKKLRPIDLAAITRVQHSSARGLS